MLGLRGVSHTLLNAHHDKSEAETVAEAGMPGRITVATNMAGRDTDIKLSEEIAAKGGLHVILSFTKAHESSGSCLAALPARANPEPRKLLQACKTRCTCATQTSFQSMPDGEKLLHVLSACQKTPFFEKFARHNIYYSLFCLQIIPPQIHVSHILLRPDEIFHFADAGTPDP